MRRGTRVGQAYVAVTADGSGINEEIVDAVDDAGEGVADAGDRHGERYGENFSEGFRDRMRARLPRIGAALSERMGRAGRDAGEEMGDEAGDTFSRRMTARARDVGDRVSEELGQRMQSRQESVRRGIQSAFSDDFADRLAQRFADRMSETLGDRIELMMAQHQQFIEENTVAPVVSGNSTRRTGSSGLVDGNAIGRMFGAGSRNNALHMLGKSVGGIINITTKLGSVAGKVFSTFSQGMAQAAEGASMLSRMGSGAGAVFSKMGTKLAASGPAAAAAIGAILVAMTVLVSVAGALLGIITALASTIVSALVGAAAVGAASLAAVAAAAGLATIAFTSMTDAQKEMLSSAFQPLKAELTGIGQLMLGQMVPAFSTWSSNLQMALLPLAGYAERFGSAFARAGNIITASFSGPGWQAFIQSLGTYLPSIVTRLSSAFGGFMNGLMGVFSAIMPQVNRFAGYLAAVGARFSAWANSAAGQNAIVDFVDRAVNSLISLWNATRSVMGFISDLLFSPQAQAAGNTMFDSIARTFEGFRQKVAEAAANGDLQRWFESAINFGAGLWAVMRGLGKVFIALYNSGVVDAMAIGMKGFGLALDGLAIILGPVIDLIGFALPSVIAAAVTPIMALAASVIAAGEAIEWLGEKIGLGNGAEDPWRGFRDIGDVWSSVAQGNMPFGSPSSTPAETAKFTLPDITPSNFSLSDLIGSGNRALNATSEDAGGYLPEAEYVNPYKKWAESLIEQGPTIAAQVRQAMRQINKDVAGALHDAARAASAGDVKSGLTSVIDSMRSNIENVVSAAQSNLSSAAQGLASASSPAEANAALREVRRAQGALTRALTAQNRVNAQAKVLARQKVLDMGNVRQLMWGTKVQGATLADFAAARERMAAKIERANEKLQAAIALRSEYKDAVIESVRAFGSLLTAEAKTVDGVEQALTATDITTNLQDRLTKIRAFQNNLRTLLSLGLGDDAYKQLVDAGVEEGSAYAEALVAGGAGAVREVNSLTSQINSAASSLGGTASNRLYKAGVDAAQGLVDGLESLSGRLDRAAARLGDSIARQVKKSLGIKSPSRVMMESMGYVGDGIVKGLEAQTRKVGMAADDLSRHVAVSPEVAQYAAAQRGSGSVSGNGGNGGDPRFRDLIVHTPTENPEAVAHEVLNEVTARL